MDAVNDRTGAGHGRDRADLRATVEAAQATFDACVDELKRLARERASKPAAAVSREGAAQRAYLQAAVRLLRAQRAWRDSLLAAEHGSALDSVGTADPASALTTLDASRLRFARWLVRTGRLSDSVPAHERCTSHS